MTVLRTIYMNDVEELGLTENYLSLDLNADMMKKDLEEMGISIKAKHFNMEETQQRVDSVSDETKNS